MSHWGCHWHHHLHASALLACCSPSGLSEGGKTALNTSDSTTTSSLLFSQSIVDEMLADCLRAILQVAHGEHLTAQLQTIKVAQRAFRVLLEPQIASAAAKSFTFQKTT